MQVTPTLLPTYTDTKGPDKTDPHVQDILLERYFRSQTITYDKVNKYHLPTLQRFLDRLGVDRSDVKLKKDLITKLLNYVSEARRKSGLKLTSMTSMPLRSKLMT